MSPIFISYKRADYDLVIQLKQRIESALDTECWFDFDSIESSKVFPIEISNAIDECKVFLFMYSKEHLKIKDFKNDWTMNELYYAKKQEKEIILIHIDNSSLIGPFSLQFESYNNIYLNDEKQFDKLINDVKKWLNPEDYNQDAKIRKELEKLEKQRLELAEREVKLKLQEAEIRCAAREKEHELEDREQKIKCLEQKMKQNVQGKEQINGFEDSLEIERKKLREKLMYGIPSDTDELLLNPSTPIQPVVQKPHTQPVANKEKTAYLRRLEAFDIFAILYWLRGMGFHEWEYAFKCSHDFIVLVLDILSIIVFSVTPAYIVYNLWWPDSELVNYIALFLITSGIVRLLFATISAVFTYLDIEGSLILLYYIFLILSWVLMFITMALFIISIVGVIFPSVSTYFINLFEQILPQGWTLGSYAPTF